MSIEVWVDDRQAGTLAVETRPGFQAQSLTFTYLDSWLADDRSFPISPDLKLQRGPHTPAPHLTIFHAFSDAAPDRWGKQLLELGARQQAKQSGRRYRALGDIDLLFAVSDETRQGALRFRESGVFLSQKPGSATIRDLSKLAHAAQRFVDDGEIDDDMRELIGAGSSPGGAQPKAWVRDADGNLLLAKFPTTAAVRDVSAWELAMIKLQRRARIRVQDARTIQLRAGESIFLTRRFDRDGERRIPYMSFKNAFMIADGNHPDYATLAQRLAGISGSPRQDAGELFSRAVMTVLVNNIDDHMRNYGLLHDGTGWRLSPSFDVNPERSGHSETPLTPDDDPRDRDIRLLIEAADSFRLTQAEAINRAKIVNEAVAQWQEDALSSGVEHDALAALSEVFESENSDRIAAMAPAQPSIIDLKPTPLQPAANEVWVKPHERRGVHVEGHFRHRPH